MTAPPTIVVSGVPRSGTSMLMQMLVAGGVEPLTDNTRPPDASNPRGYYESDAVKRLARAPDALADSAGRCVKVIHRLLAHLPPGRAYAIVFVRRDAAEIAASQAAMLARLGRPGGALSPDRLVAMIESETERALEAVRARADTELIEIPHASVLADPTSAADRLADFVEARAGWSCALDRDAMAAAVDRSLHRERSPG